MINWKPHLKEQAAALREEIINLDEEKSFHLEKAINFENIRRINTFMEGVLAYRKNPYCRNLSPPPVIWQDGDVKLLDYSKQGVKSNKNSPNNKIPVLVIPSLINRAYILDLTERRSFMRFLSDEGFAPILMDWGTPQKDESHFGLEEYISEKLIPAFDFLHEKFNHQKMHVLGYCMGGSMAMPLAISRQKAIKTLLLLATPWDFYAEGFAPAVKHLKNATDFINGTLEFFGELPVDVIQSMFTSLEPRMISNKFRKLANSKPNSEKMQDFIALEDWLNDGVPLAAKVARECLFGWYLKNQLAKGKWQINNSYIRPEKIRIPSLSVIPKKDRIVPPASAEDLANKITGSKIIEIDAGHIGMITGSNAIELTYKPVAKWIREQNSL